MDIENIGLRILLDIPASKILTSGEDLERFKKSIGEGDLDNARIILEEAVDEDMLLDAYSDRLHRYKILHILNEHSS